jgi:hypothetical protein
MSHRIVTSMGGLAVAVALTLPTPVPADAQSTSSAAKTKDAAPAWTPPRLADGHPDLQGVWDFGTLTPLERPVALGTKAFFTDEEAANFEKQENRRQNRDLLDPKQASPLYPAGGIIPYNEVWYERGSKIVGTRRTSLIVDPPNGRLPALTPEGEKAAAVRAAWQRNNSTGHTEADSYEDRPLQERCILGLNSGPPMTPGPYNNNFQMFQTADSVVILNEMVHDARIVPMDGRPHLNIRQWKGDSRGHWEGDTLVVDTTNFNRETSLAGSSASTHLTERFTRAGANTLLYEFTVEDPTTWTRPWTAVVPMSKNEEPIYEFACHEGNYAMVGILAGARAQEKAAEEAAKKAAK